MNDDLIQVSHFRRQPLPTRRDIAAVLFRQSRLILVTFLCVIVAALVSGMWTRKYEAHMKILVLRQRVDAAVTAQPNPPAQISPEVTEEDLNSEVELLRSDDLLRRVVVETRLEEKSRPLFGHIDRTTAVAMAVRKLATDLNVEPVQKANVIKVSYSSGNPQLAARVLDTVKAEYLKMHEAVHRPSGEFTFFDQQTARLRQSLQESQASLADFTAKNGVVSASLERDLALQRLADFEAAAYQARASLAETEQRIQSLQSQLATMHARYTTQVTTAENPQLMQQLKSTLLNLQLKRTELLTKYDPSYRLVKEVDQQIADAQSSIRGEQAKPPTAETTDEDPTFQVLRTELAKSREELVGLRAKAMAMETVAGRYRATARALEREGFEQEDLQREEKTREDNYLLYLKKREEARISDALDRRGILNIAVAEQPTVPALPVRSPARSAGLTVLLGICAGLGAAFAADMTSPLFRTPGDVTGFLNVQVLASLPRPREEGRG